ncbi:MAG: AAA family ATPase [Lachnospiraceae bacterium]|nr:AAA family ATPase [Lachnospiraceae bacterium]
MIRSNGYYIDKTELLYELVEETSNEVTLFTRPRRFGKTLTMSMMENFFSILKPQSSDLFADLNISQHEAFCHEWMNQYPTLFISLKDVEGLTFDSAYGMLVAEISKLCIKVNFLEDEETVDTADAEIFHRLKFKEASAEDIKNSLQIIMRMMYAVYGKPTILLIDEYDVPLAKAHANGYYREMLEVIRGLMSTSFKTNNYLKFAVVTGCLRIPKESIFTEVNNFASYSVLEEEFSQYFGFTQNEIEELLQYYDREDKIETIRKWYDGYVFGSTEIYCPWDAMSYVSELRKRPDAKPKLYWVNTSGNDAIKGFFELENTDITDKLEALLNGETITENVTNALTYEEAYNSEDNLWSILLMTGYVTAVSQENCNDFADTEDEGFRGAELRIPNREISKVFQKAVVDHFNRTADIGQIQDLMQALWNEDEDKATEILSDLLWNTISYMDYHEDYYHAFVAGIFVGRGKYAVRSNRERGLGRPDIDLRDKKNRRAMIIEAQKAESMSRMDYWCDEAIKQIVDNEYAENMNGYNKVLCYGISFFEKSAKVKLKRP